MTAVLLGIALAALAGIPVSMRLHPDADLRTRIAQSILLGLGSVTIAMVGMSVIGVHWSTLTVLMGLALVTMPFLGGLRRRVASVRVRRPGSWISFGFDGITALLLLGYCAYTALGSPVEADFVTIWGLKGRQFLHAGTIDWPFLANPDNDFTRADYPPMLPVLYAWFGLLEGGWSDRWLGLLFAATAIAGVLIVRAELGEDSGSEIVGAAGTLAIACTLLSPWVGIAEQPLSVYGLAGILLIRRSAASGRAGPAWIGSILLGLCGLLKNEGLAFVVAVCLALVISGKSLRPLVRLTPALALAFGWRALCAIHGVSGYLTRGAVVERVLSHLGDLGTLVRQIVINPVGKPMLWFGLGAAIVYGLRRVARQEQLIGLAIAFQFCFVIGAYVLSPYDISWHVRWSWDRLVSQLTPLVAYLAVVALMPGLAAQRAEDATRDAAPDGEIPA